jgi:uncharacterized protein with ParB-like and HNH nuclease domain
MAELHVSKKTLEKLLSDMQGKKFVIPDYQRPYKWDIEKCETLWKDIVDFFENEPETADYFLGTIVTATNAEGNPEVIDGQQRLTSFFLLLRAFYKKLEGMNDSDDDVLGLKMQLGPCIWDVHQISKRVLDAGKIHIFSEVATEEDNEVFHKILISGEADESQTDNYSKNYLFFKNACDNYAMTQPIKWYGLCVTILNRCIILPIECNSEETALTIFSTLNDRGMPLEDSDIFKAQLYKNCKSTEERKKFNEDWKYIAETTKEAGLSIDDVFRYYTHIIRARSIDKTKEVGLRRFYAQESYKRLKQEGFVKEIINLVNFWWYINMFETPEDYPEENEPYSISVKAQKYLDVLMNYPNDFWKYVTSVFYFSQRESEGFSNKFELFLENLTGYLFVKFIEYPSVNAIKDDIYTACIEVYKSGELGLTFNFDNDSMKQRIEGYSSSKVARGLLLLDAYLHANQKDVIRGKLEIEHIFPKKWQSTNYNGWSQEDAQIYLEKFGNKVLFEKKLNIEAGNGYFGKKKSKYSKSKVARVLELAELEQSDWLKDDIEKRNERFINTMLAFFKKTVRKA